MNYVTFFCALNYYLAIPTSLILLGSALWLTVKLNGIQLRGLPTFVKLLKHGVVAEKDSTIKSINPFHALFIAMSTSLGIGTIVGPSVAIIIGGPGALFWLTLYALIASVIKFVEVTFAVQFRKETADGRILGGPMQYLSQINYTLSWWYAGATMILFAGWSGLQANVLAEVLAQDHIPAWVTGFVLAGLVFIMLNGGAKRIGEFNSKLVPFMSFLYITFGLIILYLNRQFLPNAFYEIINNAFSASGAIGGFAGASVIMAIQTGVYKGAYITESGIGTAAIPHSIANVKKPTDQGILAMVSVLADTFFCLLSGILILTTAHWHIDYLSNILLFRVFQDTLPGIGKPILVLTITLFALGTIIGNSFNGRQSFASLTRYRWLLSYHIFVCSVIFFGSLIDVPLIWAIIEVLLPFVAVPNVLSLVYLVYKNRAMLDI